MNNKGFTLVELLGVIVITCALAIIIGISVTSILKSSKSQLSDIQIKSIEKAAKTYFLKEGMNEVDIAMNESFSCVDVEYLIDNDYIEASEIKNPTDNNSFTGSVMITYDSKKYRYEYQESVCSPCKLVSGEPNTIGSKYECEVKKGTKYNFYVLSHEDNGITNLIMERNICEDGTLATEENTCLVAYNIDGDVSGVGPVTAMNYINNATSDWNNIQNLNLTYDDEGENFTSFKITGKARLPYKREVNAVGCGDYETLTCPVWMVDYLHDAGPDSGESYQENPINGAWGYWTLSSYVDDSYVAWYVDYVGNVNSDLVDNDGNGVRPVINVKLDNDVKEEILEPKSFAEDSWETIATSVRAGNLSKYKVGDTKEITLTGDVAGTYTVRIANTSTPSECNQEGFSQTACGFVIEFVDIISEHVMNSTDTNEGGWEASEMRSYVNNEIYNAFPENLRKLIIDTYVVSGHEPGKTENYKTTDKIYLLSTGEIWAQGTSHKTTYDTAREETRQLDYYKNTGVTTSNYSGVIKQYNGSTNIWWLRSANSDYTITFSDVNGHGDCTFNIANGTYGVAVAFRL